MSLTFTSVFYFHPVSFHSHKIE